MHEQVLDGAVRAVRTSGERRVRASGERHPAPAAALPAARPRAR
ncbi:hypothetical protein [Streptomyces sulfonofaciens]|nr:hypothetical protein [Streptomyces sulfonofaciens]